MTSRSSVERSHPPGHHRNPRYSVPNILESDLNPAVSTSTLIPASNSVPFFANPEPAAAAAPGKPVRTGLLELDAGKLAHHPAAPNGGLHLSRPAVAAHPAKIESSNGSSSSALNAKTGLNSTKPVSAAAAYEEERLRSKWEEILGPKYTIVVSENLFNVPH